MWGARGKSVGDEQVELVGRTPPPLPLGKALGVEGGLHVKDKDLN